MNALSNFSKLFETHTEFQIEQRQRDLIENYIQNDGFEFSSDKTKVFGKLVDPEGNIHKIEENVKIDINKEVLRVFKIGLNEFKRKLNDDLLNPEYSTNRLESLKIIKFQLEVLLTNVSEKFPNSHELVKEAALKPAIEFTNDYLQQLLKSNTIVIKPTQINWNSSIVSLCRYIKLALENDPKNKNKPLITNNLYEVIDFVTENFTWHNEKIKRDSLNRSTKDDRTDNLSGHTRVRMPKKTS